MKVKEEIDKIFIVGFIRQLKKATWLSPVVVVPKKNGKIRVCVDYRKINAATITDACALPFTDGVLDGGVDHEIYSFLEDLVPRIGFGCTQWIRKSQYLSPMGEFL